MTIRILLTLILSLSIVADFGCASAGPRKYVLFGEPQAERVETFEDYWTDYPFKPDDPSLPLRRGKGGVVRFFKKDNYSRSVMVDGDLTVNVYYSVKEGVTLTQPDAQLVMTSKELNEKYRKFDKKIGYSYHIYLDLGEYDQPEEEITILSVFKDTKTGQVTLSKEIRTTTLGTSPVVHKDEDDGASEAEKIAQKMLGVDSENPIAELQKRYAARNRQRKEADVAKENTRLRDSIDLSSSQFSDIDSKPTGIESASYLSNALERQDSAREKALEENREKLEYYRDKKRRQLEEYEASRNKKDETTTASLRDSSNAMSPMEFSRAEPSYVNLQNVLTEKFESSSQKTIENVENKEKEGPNDTSKYADPILLKSSNNVGGYTQTPYNMTPNSSLNLKKDYVPVDSTYTSRSYSTPSEMDRLGDFIPSQSAPPTEVFVKKTSDSKY